MNWTRSMTSSGCGTATAAGAQEGHLQKKCTRAAKAQALQSKVHLKGLFLWPTAATVAGSSGAVIHSCFGVLPVHNRDGCLLLHTL